MLFREQPLCLIGVEAFLQLKPRGTAPPMGHANHAKKELDPFFEQIQTTLDCCMHEDD